MKKVLTIIEVENRIGKKSGKPYRVAQCIVIGENQRVGELMVFNDQIELKPGQYEAFFDVTVNYEKNVTSELISLKPYTGALPGAGAAAAALKA